MWLSAHAFTCIHMKPCANNLPNLLMSKKHKKTTKQWAWLVPDIIYFSEMFEYCFLNDAQLSAQLIGEGKCAYIAGVWS